MQCDQRIVYCTIWAFDDIGSEENAGGEGLLGGLEESSKSEGQQHFAFVEESYQQVSEVDDRFALVGAGNHPEAYEEYGEGYACTDKR